MFFYDKKMNIKLINRTFDPFSIVNAIAEYQVCIDIFLNSIDSSKNTKLHKSLNLRSFFLKVFYNKLYCYCIVIK